MLTGQCPDLSGSWSLVGRIPCEAVSPFLYLTLWGADLCGSGLLGWLPGAILLSPLSMLLSRSSERGPQTQAQVGWSQGPEEVGLQDGGVVR